MRVILEFNLPEEREEYLMATQAGEMSCALSDIKNYIRSRLKYEDPGSEATKDLEHIRELITDRVRDE